MMESVPATAPPPPHTHLTAKIDLCTPDGELKNVSIHGDQNGASFFEPRELCLVVAISGTSNVQALISNVSIRLHALLCSVEVDGHPYYTPTLPDYANNELFVGKMLLLTAFDPVIIPAPGNYM